MPNWPNHPVETDRSGGNAGSLHHRNYGIRLDFSIWNHGGGCSTAAWRAVLSVGESR